MTDTTNLFPKGKREKMETPQVFVKPQQMNLNEWGKFMQLWAMSLTQMSIDQFREYKQLEEKYLFFNKHK